jgi:hypothetical protein
MTGGLELVAEVCAVHAQPASMAVAPSRHSCVQGHSASSVRWIAADSHSSTSHAQPASLVLSTAPDPDLAAHKHGARNGQAGPWAAWSMLVAVHHVFRGPQVSGRAAGAADRARWLPAAAAAPSLPHGESESSESACMCGRAAAPVPLPHRLPPCTPSAAVLQAAAGVHVAQTGASGLLACTPSVCAAGEQHWDSAPLVLLLSVRRG